MPSNPGTFDRRCNAGKFVGSDHRDRSASGKPIFATLNLTCFNTNLDLGNNEERAFGKFRKALTQFQLESVPPVVTVLDRLDITGLVSGLGSLASGQPLRILVARWQFNYDILARNTLARTHRTTPDTWTTSVPSRFVPYGGARPDGINVYTLAMISHLHKFYSRAQTCLPHSSLQ